MRMIGSGVVVGEDDGVIGELRSEVTAGAGASEPFEQPDPAVLHIYSFTPLANFVEYAAVIFASFSNPARARSFPSCSQAAGSTYPRPFVLVAAVTMMENRKSMPAISWALSRFLLYLKRMSAASCRLAKAYWNP